MPKLPDWGKVLGESFGQFRGVFHLFLCAVENVHSVASEGHLADQFLEVLDILVRGFLADRVQRPVEHALGEPSSGFEVVVAAGTGSIVEELLVLFLGLFVDDFACVVAFVGRGHHVPHFADVLERLDGGVLPV